MAAKPKTLDQRRSFSQSLAALTAILVVSASPAHAATYVVNSTADTVDANVGDGICDDGTGACTLRAASQEATYTPSEFCDGPDEPRTIQIIAVGTISLASPIALTSYRICALSIAIVGPGSQHLTLEGGGLILAGGRYSAHTEASGFTVTGADVGIVVPDQEGGGAQLRDVVVVGNGRGISLGYQMATAIEDSVIADNAGDGISTSTYFITAGLTLLNTHVDHNGGSGVSAPAYYVSVLHSTIRDNDGVGLETGGAAVPSVEIHDSIIDGNGGGGVINSYGRSTDIVASTISNNGGSGLSVFGPLTITNSTISGNRAATHGGGIRIRIDPHANEQPAAVLRNATIVRNRADADGDGTGDGGGIWVGPAEGDPVDISVVSLANTILAENSDAGGEAPDCGAVLTSAGYNLIQDTTGCTLAGSTPLDLIGADPRLGDLQDNGGPTPTHALLADSPARNAGDPNGCTGGDAPLTTDQRGAPRPVFGRCDIGAFERACGNAGVELGETCDDGNTLDGDCCSAECRLEPEGAPCDDGDACTIADACDGGGTCAGGAPTTCAPCGTCDATLGCVVGPRPRCLQSVRRSGNALRIANKQLDARDYLLWTWTKGEATTRADLGDPIGGEGYTFCLFDESGPTPRVLVNASARTGQCGRKPCWKRRNKTTFEYKDQARTPDGVAFMILKAGEAGESKTAVFCQGPHLDLPALPLPLPMRAQLQAENGQCWESHYSAVGVSKNGVSRFKAKAATPTR